MAGQGKYFGYYSKYLEKLLESFQQVAWFDLEDDSGYWWRRMARGK